MEEVRQKITQVLDQFLQEEFGNRLSQFALLSLKSMILGELNKLGKEQEAEKESQAPNKIPT
jgi:hypothetical protein